MTFQVKDSSERDNKEKWELKEGCKTIMIHWKDHVSYNANKDTAFPRSLGKLQSEFIHVNESVLRFDFKNATLPLTITIEEMMVEMVVLTVNAAKNVSSPFPFDKRGTRVDVTLPVRLRPGQVVRWYADANPADGLTMPVYSHVIGDGTA